MPNKNNLIVPFADQYVGVWAIRAENFNALLGQAQNINLQLHLEQSTDPEKQAAIKKQAAIELQTTRGGSIAVIELHGSLSKQASSFSSSRSMVAARRQVRAAVNDPDIQGIALHIDSPGGTVAGTVDLADEIAAAARKMPVHAFIEDLGASAAFWLASQATAVFANSSAEIGSIGVFSVITDWSARAEKDGAKVNVIRFGEFKGAGIAGTEITEDQLAEWQKTVDAFGEMFVSAIAKGRNMPKAQARQLADGRIHMATDAIDLSLIDGIQTFEATLDGLAEAIRKVPRKTEANAMADQDVKTADQPATLAELESNLVGAKSDFLLSQLKAKATLPEAMQAFVAMLASENTQLAEGKADAEKRADEVTQKQTTNKRGVSALGDTSDGSGESVGAKEAYFEVFNGYLAQGMTRSKASSMMARKHNDLRVAFVEEANRNR